MTTRSQNGWSVDSSRIASYTIPGTTERVALRHGAASIVLLDFAGFINAQVEPLQQKTLDEWGYAVRNIRGSSTTISNHSSGTAIDINARQHPLGVEGTWSARQIEKVHARIRLYDGCVRWGQDYHDRKDGMHAEIIRGWGALHDLAVKIRHGELGHGELSYLVGREPFANTKHPHDHDDGPRHSYPENRGPFQNGDEGTHVHLIEEHLKALGFYDGRIDSIFGDKLESAVRSFQEHEHIGVDGVVGPTTWRHIFQ